MNSIHSSFSKLAFYNYEKKEMIIFKPFKLLLNLFQRDGSINGMLFWPKLLLLNDISKSICPSVICISRGNKTCLDKNYNIFIAIAIAVAIVKCN